MSTPVTVGPRNARQPVFGELRGLVEALLMVAASTLVGLVMAPRWGNAAIDLLYLPAVLAAAVRAGLRPALLAALASALAYNFFFTAPHYTFRIQDPADALTVAILFLVAVVTSHLAASIRRQAQLAAAHAARNATIAGLARRLLSCSSEKEIAQIACSELFGLFTCNVVLVGGHPQPEVIASAPEVASLTPSDIAAAALVLETGKPTGRGISRVELAEWQFHSVRAESAVLAAIGLARDDGSLPLSAEHRPLLENLLDQVALALERARLEAEAREVAGLRERDRLRSALLSSVGHDLRTPLTTIIAAASELRRSGPPDEAVLGAISSEASKLERYISNLLDMARIEAGAVMLKAEPVDLVDTVAAALKDVRRSLDGHEIEVDLPQDLPLVRADAQLLHHCLINLLDNAGRHSGPGTRIGIRGRVVDGSLLLSIEDEGPGLEGPDRPLETFASISGSDRTGGTGVGLAIVKAFAEAMGADVTACNASTGTGASFTVRFSSGLLLPGTNAANVR
jgi:two-component system sensor histidine kinase KdpD